MTHNPRSDVRPRRMLLATDLSSRSDRAFDRAVHLARDWNAELHLVHAVEAPPPAVPAGVDAQAYLRRYPDQRAAALRGMHALVAHGDVHASLHVEDAPAAQAILAVAAREACDLVILGESREQLVGPLETTLERVVRASPVSVLAVRNRVRGRYDRLLVGTDFTAEAQQALVLAASLFPRADITLMHAYAMPYAGLLASQADDPDWIERERDRLRAHVDEVELADARKSSLRLRIERGQPAPALRRRVLDEDIDLTVIGAHPRGMLFDAVVGNSRSIVEAVPGDVLVVRAVRGDVA